MKCYQATGILFAKYNQRALMRNSFLQRVSTSVNSLTEGRGVNLHKSKALQDLEPLLVNLLHFFLTGRKSAQ